MQMEWLNDIIKMYGMNDIVKILSECTVLHAAKSGGAIQI